MLLPTDRMRASQGARLLLLGVPFALLIFMTGTRNETGNDWQPYIDYYRGIDSIEYNSENFEIGYRLFAYAAKSVGLSYAGFLFVSTLIYMSAFFLAFRRQRGALALVLLFYCTYLLGWMGTARQVIALGLTVCAGECLLDGRKLWFAVLTVVAATFHQTAIIFLLFWFMRRSLPSTRTIITVAAASVVLGQALTYVLPAIIDNLTGLPGLGEKALFYIGTSNESLGQAAGEVLGVLFYVKRLVFLLVFVLLRRHLSETPRLAVYFNAYLFSVAFFLLLNPTVPILAARGANYFSIYELFLRAALMVSRGRYMALAIPLIILLSGQRLYTALYAYHPDLYIPYKGLFINDDFRREVY
jgi:hypothetical protein